MVGDQAVTDAAARYLALLLGVTSSFGDTKPAGGSSAAAAEAGSPDEALEAAEAGAGSAGGKGSPLGGAPSKLRHAGAWEWGDAALVAPAPGTPPRKAASSDALFELAQVRWRCPGCCCMLRKLSSSGMAGICAWATYHPCALGAPSVITPLSAGAGGHCREADARR